MIFFRRRLKAMRKMLGFCLRKSKQVRFFLLPNIIKILNGQVKGSYSDCNQLTLITGLGSVEFGSNCTLGYKRGGFHRSGMIELQSRYTNAIIKLGNNIATNNNILICAANYIEIGDDTLIGQYVTIMDFEAHGIHPLHRRDLGEVGNIIIGKNVWIGNNVIILKNSKIGDNSIVSAGAVVTGKLFPSNVIIGGVPAKIIAKL